jgi:predicted TIM-barrel fold metal-dependent hydrolase
MNTMGRPRILGEIAERHPGGRFWLDHLGFEPFHTYDDLTPVTDEVVALARYANVAVKATCAPSGVAEKYPFPSLHEPLRRIIEAFGPQRVFWGSDLTRLPCTYLECKRLFTDELRFLSADDLEWIMGRAICKWLDWPP